MSKRKVLKSNVKPVLEETKSSVLNVLDALDSLLKKQLDRIEIDAKSERNLGKLFGTTGEEIDVARRIILAYDFIQRETENS